MFVRSQYHHHFWGFSVTLLPSTLYELKGIKLMKIWLKFGIMVMMKFLMMEYYLLKGYHDFMNNFFITVLLGTALYQLGTSIVGIISEKKKFLPQALRNQFVIGEKHLKNCPIPALAVLEEVTVSSLNSQIKWKTMKELASGLVSKVTPSVLLQFRRRCVMVRSNRAFIMYCRVALTAVAASSSDPAARDHCMIAATLPSVILINENCGKGGVGQ
jgi:hypothetical protein